MLLLDRLLASTGSALDLATGVPVKVRHYARATGTPLYATRGGWRLIDAGEKPPRGFAEIWARSGEVPACPAIPIDAVRAALLDARDGTPRAVDVCANDSAHWRRMCFDIARESRLAGFVPVSAGVLGEILRGHHWRWPRWLTDRSLVVLTCDGQLTAAGSVALLRLATRDARPHLVVRGATRGISPRGRLVSVPMLVHEDAGHESATPQSLAQAAWDRAEQGKADDDAAAAARWAVILAPDAEVETTARAALSITLATQGRTLEARAALPDEQPELSADAIERVGRARHCVEELAQPRRRERALADDFLRVLEACQAMEDERATVGHVLTLVRDRVAAAGVACVIAAERGTCQTVGQVGVLPADHSAALQVIVSGVANQPRRAAGPRDGAWPVRYAGTTVGALWCRWAAGLPILEADADGLLSLAATAMAPAVAAVAERVRAQTAPTDVPELVGNSDAMRALRASVVRAARSPFPVLIEGESGSGKELVARAIHRTSIRRERRFSALNCAALAEELAEAELFGHARGAFTGAVAERLGLFEESTGGTLFLDEVSELSLRIQAKLLRVLQEHEVRRLGESRVRAIDVRIVAATNKPLAGEVQAGRFRRDLCYRLDVIRLTIPPLRERLEDLPPLVQHIWTALLQKTGSRAVLSPATLAALGRYDWPGNVRELQNVLASLIVSSPTRGPVAASQLPAHIGRAVALGESLSLAAARLAFERRFVTAALARVNGKSTLAARQLGVSRQGLAKVLTRLGLATDARRLGA